jgi:ankyrin repeat protein
MSDFVKFAENGNLDEVKRLFQPKIINTRDKENDTALLKASQNCNATNVVSFLLENGADVDDRDLIDQTPLIIASQHGCKDIVELLLKADSNIKHKNQQGETALISATQEGHIDVVKILLDTGADVNEQNAEGETPLMLAINLRHKKELVDLLRMNLCVFSRKAFSSINNDYTNNNNNNCNNISTHFE